MGRLANYTMSGITAIVTIITFVGFLTSKSLNTWTKTHSEIVFCGFIVSFMVAGASLNFFFEQRKKYRKLKESTARVKPSEHDSKLFQSLITMLPPAGPIMVWLKENFAPNAFLRKDYEAIEAVIRYTGLQSLQFDNSNVKTSYDQLCEAMQKFEDVTLQYMHKDPGNPWLRISPNLDGERSGRATDEISQVRLELIRTYDNFLDLAHQNGIDQ